jgi:cytochrome c biogenesis protein CcmG/thiol:disulfide interchange protein DsbE
MPDTSPATPLPANAPARPEPDPPPPEAATPTVDDIAAGEGEAHGRIGYGQYGRLTPLALAALLVLGLLAIGIYRQGSGKPATKPNALIGRPAPDVTLTLLNGSPLRLADLRGSVVLVNIWASWCDPCRRESPDLEAVSKESAPHGTKVVVVGVGLKNDVDANARAFVRDLGLTYPIGRDLGGTDPTFGPIERAFGVDPNRYPETFVIRPDGTVAAVQYGQTDAKQLRRDIAQAEQ